MAKFQEYKSYVKSSGDWMTLKQGENKVRVVSEFEPFESEYNGKKRTRFMGWVIDRADGEIKPLTIGSQIFGQLGELSVSSEYGFDALPPYDVVIKKSGEGIDTEYTTLAARQNTELTETEKVLIKDLKPITDVIEAMNKKSGDKIANTLGLKDSDLPKDEVDDVNAELAGRKN